MIDKGRARCHWHFRGNSHIMTLIRRRGSVWETAWTPGAWFARAPDERQGALRMRIRCASWPGMRDGSDTPALGRFFQLDLKGSPVSPMRPL